MASIKDIQVLIIEPSPAMQVKFLEYCGSVKGLRIAALLSSCQPLLLLGDLASTLREQGPDVVIYGFTDSYAHKRQELEQLRAVLPAQYIAFSEDIVDKETAVRRGLFAWVTRPQPGSLREEDVFTKLVYQVRNARLSGSVSSFGCGGAWAALPLPQIHQPQRVEAVFIGASAGGTVAISKVVNQLPADFPCVLVAQHMPEGFTKLFANNLAAKSAMTVTEAQGGEPLQRGCIYVAPGDRHLTVACKNGGYVTCCTDGEKVSGHRPSVDVLFHSAAVVLGSRAIGVILTGMGADGAAGLLAMHQAGAYTFGQDKESSVVYGMPEVAFSLGAVTRQLSLEHIGSELIRYVNSRKGR